MPPAEPILSAPLALPNGYFPVVLLPEFAAGPLRLCVIVRRDPDPVAGHFVMLRTLLDAMVYLGCVTDNGGKLHGYVEIAVQSLSGLAGSPAAAREALSNRILDDRWSRLFKAYDSLDDQPTGPAVLYRTGFETVHPAPLFYDTEKHEIIHPVDAFSNTSWKLCTDDALLAAKGLPPYSSSLHRYLVADAKSPLVPVTPEAPTGPNTAPLTEITGPRQTLLPLNPGGLLLVRQYDPAALEPFFDLLSGTAWEGILAGRTAVHLNRLNEAVEEKSGSTSDMADGRLFLGKHGKWGRLIETFHLKLRIFADCLHEVHALTTATQRPQLNLTAQSFQIDIGAGAQAYALPFLWTATARLVDPGDAVTLKAGGGAGGNPVIRSIFCAGFPRRATSISRNPSPSRLPGAARSASARQWRSIPA